MSEQLTFMRWLQLRRRALDLTQLDLARRVACAAVTIHKIETGRLRPSVQIAERLVEHLEIPLEERSAFVRWARLGYSAIPPGFSSSATEQLYRLESVKVPSFLSRFIGRDVVLREIVRIMRDPGCRLLTLTGPGGIGKTRLAVEVASEVSSSFDDDVYFVSLAAVRDPDLIAPTLAQSLGVREISDEPIIEQVKAFLAYKKPLLVIDNFEHLIKGAGLLGELLAAAPYLKLLVTSREVLQLYGEHQITVPPLSLPARASSSAPGSLPQSEAEQLFIERARAVRPGFPLTESDACIIGEICTRLDGLPLAIELIAARIRLFPPPVLLAHLADVLNMRTGRVLDMPLRHQTLHGAIAWSFDLLEPEEQKLFARLAIFDGGWTLQAAESVCNSVEAPGIDVLVGLTSLVHKSLVWCVPAVSDTSQARFGFLETVREYAFERLERSGDASALRAAHLDYYLAMVAETRGEGPLWSAKQSAHLEQIDTDLHNLRAAIRWSLVGGHVIEGAQLVLSLFTFWWVRGYWSVAREWLGHVLEQRAYLPAELYARCLNAAGWYNYYQGHISEAQGFFEEALALCNGLKDRWGVAFATYNLASVAADQGHRDRTARLLTEALTEARINGDSWLQQAILVSCGIEAVVAETYDSAISYFEEALLLAESSDDQYMRALILTNLTNAIYWSSSSHKRVLALYREVIELFEKLGDRYGIAGALCWMARCAFDEQRYEDAVVGYQQSLILYWQIGCKPLMVDPLYGLVTIAVNQAYWHRAARLMGIVDHLRSELGDLWNGVLREEWNTNLQKVQAGLPDSEFAAAWEEGRQMPFPDLVRYGLEPPQQ